MATTFDVIYLGTAADLDPNEGGLFFGDDDAENAGSIVGNTYGSAGNPLHENQQQLSADNYSAGSNIAYDTDNYGTNDTFRIDGGSPQTFDSVVVYNATITYIDGTTANISAVVFQDTDGRLYLAPEITDNADRVAMEAKPLQSLTLDSVVSNSTNLTADRYDSDFVDVVDGTAGNDTMNPGYTDSDGEDIDGGKDYVLAGDGDDFINAEGGDDTVYAGAGNDTIDDWLGDDEIYAEAGDDVANVSTGSNLFDMGSGNDTVNVFDNIGDNTLVGGADEDTVDFDNWQSSDGVNITGTGDGAGSFSHYSGNTTGTFSEFENIAGTANADTIDMSSDSSGMGYQGEGGDDSITTGSGADTIDGGTGADTISGGGGNDSIVGGTGNDSLTGGAGDDTFTYTAGDGLDTITDFNTGNSGAINDGDSTNNDFVDLSLYYDNLFELWADQADDGILNQSNTTNTNGDAVDYSDNTQFGPGEGLIFTGATADDTFFNVDNTGVICFTPGALVSTPSGLVPIEHLRPGDFVVTRDNGLKPILWVGHKQLDEAALAASPHLKPIQLKQGLFGLERDLIVSPQHGMLALSRARGGDETLVRAKHLAELQGGAARRMNGCRSVTYIHLLFEGHQLIQADGCWSESLYPGPVALGTMEQKARDEVLQLFPELPRMPVKAAFGTPARHYGRPSELPTSLSRLCA